MVVKLDRTIPRFSLAVPLLVAALLLPSCESPQQRALRELSDSGIEPSGHSLVQSLLDRNTRRTALLLEARVYTEQRDTLGRTPLAIAVENGDESAAFLLLEARANVNARMAGHAGILGFAVERGDTKMVETLLAGGARTDGLMRDGERILPWAIRRGHLGMVRAMMKSGADPHDKDQHGNPLLHVAMESGRRDLTESLIELGADPGATNAAGESTIHLALRHGWKDIIPMLAAAGADPNASDPDGRTLLETAVAARDVECIALLLRIGANPNRHPVSGGARGPFQQVFESPDPSLFEVFLDHGARPPGGTWDAWLWQAFHSKDIGKARLMLSRGARNPQHNAAGLELLEAAALTPDIPFAKLLLDYGFPANRALYFASASGAHDLASVLLAGGASPRITNFPTRDTALAAAIRGRHDRCAELLLRHGADPSLTPPEGQSLFLLAVATGCPRTVAHLLADGANPNAEFTRPVSPAFIRLTRPGIMRWALNKDRNVTPLMVAADSGCIQTTRYLMKAGAKSSVYTRVGKLWPINFASRRDDVRMMRLFLGQDPFREERVVEIRLSEQRARLYDAGGKELFSTQVSTGRKGYDTPTGEYVITNKYRHWTSTLYHASMPYFQRFSCGDFGMHQGSVPNYPASHGCVRIPSGNASKMFSMTETGDRVRIVP